MMKRDEIKQGAESKAGQNGIAAEREGERERERESQTDDDKTVVAADVCTVHWKHGLRGVYR
jgi:hypothetical protein